MTEDEHHREIRRLEKLAHWLDSRFRIPGTNVRFGVDSILGLFPGVGDTATTIPAVYLILCAQRLGVPRRVLMRMSLNVVLDLVLGAIPVVGDAFDVGFKANRKNVDLVRRHASALKNRHSRGA